MSNSQKIFITGTSAGFGFDATKALAEKGHTIYATMRGVEGKNAAKAKELGDWASAGGHAVHVFDLDVTDDASVDKAVAAAVEQGGIDILINNAGVGTVGIQETFTIDQVEKLFAVNVFGVLRVNRAVLPHFREKGTGSVFYISSGLGRLIIPFLNPYTATKFAVEALAEGGSYELAPLGIETVIIQPGAYGTTFMSNAIQPADQARIGTYGKVVEMFQAFGSGFEERAKAGQIGNPQEVTDALVELVETPKGQRPLRRPVGADIAEGVTALNQLSEQIQNKLLEAFGLK